MLVRELLEKRKNDEDIKVFQVPIKEIDTCEELVKRYEGDREVSFSSNQNYLDFVILYYYHDNGYLIVICKASTEQENRIIVAHKKHWFVIDFVDK